VGVAFKVNKDGSGYAVLHHFGTITATGSGSRLSHARPGKDQVGAGAEAFESKKSTNNLKTCYLLNLGNCFE
jgi:hypothetical protein